MSPLDDTLAIEPMAGRAGEGDTHSATAAIGVAAIVNDDVARLPGKPSELRAAARAQAAQWLEHRLVSEAPSQPSSLSRDRKTERFDHQGRGGRDGPRCGGTIGRYGEVLSTGMPALIRPRTAHARQENAWSPRQSPQLQPHRQRYFGGAPTHRMPVPTLTKPVHKREPREPRPFAAAENPIFAFLRRAKPASGAPAADIRSQLRASFGGPVPPAAVGQAARNMMPYTQGRSDVPATEMIRPPSRLRMGDHAQGLRARSTKQRPASANPAAGAFAASQEYAAGTQPATARPRSAHPPLSRSYAAQPPHSARLASSCSDGPAGEAYRGAAGALPAPHDKAAGPPMDVRSLLALEGSGSALPFGARALGDTEIEAIMHREACMAAIAMLMQTVRRVRGQSVRLTGRIASLFQWRLAQSVRQPDSLELTSNALSNARSAPDSDPCASDVPAAYLRPAPRPPPTVDRLPVREDRSSSRCASPPLRSSKLWRGGVRPTRPLGCVSCDSARRCATCLSRPSLSGPTTCCRCARCPVRQRAAEGPTSPPATSRVLARPARRYSLMWGPCRYLAPPTRSSCAGLASTPAGGTPTLASTRSWWARVRARAASRRRHSRPTCSRRQLWTTSHAQLLPGTSPTRAPPPQEPTSSAMAAAAAAAAAVAAATTAPAGAGVAVRTRRTRAPPSSRAWPALTAS